MYISFPRLLRKIKNEGVTVEIERRDQGEGWYDYGYKMSHASIVGLKNRTDNEEWDVLILGYRKPKFSYGQHFKTNIILGIVFVSDGNHKILMKVPYKRGFDKKVYNNQVKNFMRNYRRRWGPTLEVVYQQKY